MWFWWHNFEDLRLLLCWRQKYTSRSTKDIVAICEVRVTFVAVNATCNKRSTNTFPTFEQRRETEINGNKFIYPGAPKFGIDWDINKDL